MSQIRLSKLTGDAEWDHLRRVIDPQGNSPAVGNVLRQLRENGAVSAILEEEYLDQDFTASYSAFYSTVFKRYTKICKRFHFFSQDISGSLNNATAEASTIQLQEIGDKAYLGFIVCRPLAHAPLGRVVTRPPKAPAGTAAENLVYAPYDVHLLGSTLSVKGLAMTQQDARVGACAQASIWMAGRHFHLRHRGPWFSTVDITKAAISPTDASISLSLPAGSESLGLDHMARALRTMERRPLVRVANVIDPKTTPWTVQWTTNRPEDLIGCYVDSGIPVILVLSPAATSASAHAVLATGRVTKQLDPNTTLPPRPSYASFCEFFLINDDQRGINLRMPVHPNTAYSEVPYSVHGYVPYIIVPLPNKVFMAGEAAERISWDMIDQYTRDWDAHKSLHSGLGHSFQLGDKLVSDSQRGAIVSRTYLTYGWKYKARMLKNNISSDFKSALFYHDLPRFVWVTEFGTLASLNHLDVRRRRIFAHNVVDATASRFWESRCIFHAPGMSIRYFPDPANPFGDLTDAVTPSRDDAPYFPKVRGETDYSLFGQP